MSAIRTIIIKGTWWSVRQESQSKLSHAPGMKGNILSPRKAKKIEDQNRI